MTVDREKKIAEIREALEKATRGSWKWEGVQHATSGSLYEPPEPYHPAEVFVEVDDEQLISDDIVVIARLDDPMYLVETDEEGDTGERYLGSANANANLIANAPEWLGFLLDELDRLEREYAEERAAQHEIERLQEENHKLREQRDAYYKSAQFAEAAAHGIEKLREENRKMIEGLRWYAEPTNWEYRTSYLDQDSPILDDCGQRARDILEEIGVTVE